MNKMMLGQHKFIPIGRSLALFICCLLFTDNGQRTTTEATDNSCVTDCVKGNRYYKDNCKKGLDLGDECSSDSFCSTPYARCLDGECSCLPGFQQRNVTYGRPATCVPEPNPTDLGGNEGDICRMSKSNNIDDSIGKTIKMSSSYSGRWARWIMPKAVVTCPVGCKVDKKKSKQLFGDVIVLPSSEWMTKTTKKRRSKRSAMLPPTVVNECNAGKACFPIGPSHFGVCKKPKCPVGAPSSSKLSCDPVTNDCPSGYYCIGTDGEAVDKEGIRSKASICCPSICQNGYYRNGRCYKNEGCLNEYEKCDARCNYEPCRFMVDPCENFGLCLVPRVKRGAKPDYFWCQCTEDYTGKVCQVTGNGGDRPHESRRVACEGTFCDPPIYYQPPPPPPLIAPSPIIPRPLPLPGCKSDARGDCRDRASKGQCFTNGPYMKYYCGTTCCPFRG